MDKKRIILVGGGTLGSVNPLLAIAGQYKAQYLFVGTDNGLEKDFVKAANIDFKSIKSGKFRRYFSWENFLDIFRVKWAFFQSLKIIWQFKPDIVLSAGSFVAVPMVWAAWLLRIPAVIHQQDIEIGLANKVMAPFAKKITVTFSAQKKYFKENKVVVTGNPVRIAPEAFEGKPILLITGGGLGARGLNDFIKPFIPSLTKIYEVHHILGDKNWDQRLDLENYFPHSKIITNMMELIAKADIVISRAGMSLITEVASLRKPLILIPMPNSHQEKNAAYLAKQNAVMSVSQGANQVMERYLFKLTNNDSLRDALGDNLYNIFPKNAVKNYIKLIETTTKK